MLTQDTAVFPVFSNAYLVEAESTSDHFDVYIRAIKTRKEQRQYGIGDFIGDLIFASDSATEILLPDGRKAYGETDLFTSN